MLIEKLAEIIASFFSNSHNPDALESFLELLILPILLTAAAFTRPILFSVPFVRNRISYNERYAGHYVQIINSGTDRRYSLLTVRYQNWRKGYVLRGFQYDTEGKRLIDFDSENVAFVKSSIPYIEFIWSAEILETAETFSGYTHMRLDTPSPDIMEGRGFFITFDKPPRRFDLRFIKLTHQSFEALENLAGTVIQKSRNSNIRDKQHKHLKGIKFKSTKSLKSEADRGKLIRYLHRILFNRPELPPDDDNGEKPFY